jgi:UDP-N-acetylglucosamine--N-acetylmuramyl-(pentapeptide) pyrophosphoryl-undecaprenol N-acetylglucosamine transferase
MPNNKTEVLFVCERSGGHIFPALAFARQFQHNGLAKPEDICFFITADFFKANIEKEGYKTAGKSFAKRNMVFEAVWRFFEAIYILTKLRPKKIFGFGGRDSFFLVLLGSLTGSKIVVYDPNLKMGKANKILSLVAGKVLRGFENEYKSKKTSVAGIPLRENIITADRGRTRSLLGFDSRPVIFCFGGSQGSAFLNKIFLRLINDLEGSFQVIHLTGPKEYAEISNAYNKMMLKRFVKDFYYQMEKLYSSADLIICRSGASTLAEIAYYQLPAILIPHPLAGGHQKDNALYFSQRKAGVFFSEDKFSYDKFKDTVQGLLSDPGSRAKMKENLAKIKLGIEFKDFISRKIEY